MSAVSANVDTTVQQRLSPRGSPPVVGDLTRLAPGMRSAQVLPWVLAVVCALITGAVILLAHHQVALEEKRAVASAMRDNENLLHALEAHVSSAFMNADELAWSIKQHVERRGLPNDLRALFSERTIPDSPVLLGHITDETGATVRHTHSSRTLYIAHRLHFRSHVHADHQQLVVGEPMVGGVSGKWSVHVSRRINKPDGSFAGAVTVALDQGYFSRFYGQVKLGDEGFVLLVGKDGIVRAHDGRPVGSIGERLKSLDLLEHAAARPAGSFVAPAAEGQVARIVSYRTVERYPLILVVGTSVDDALAQHFENRLDYAVGAGIVIGLLWTGLALLAWIQYRQRRAALLLQEANGRVEAANRAKSEFLANMTHELRTPLNGIIGFADCLQDELEDEARRECARVIYVNGCSLLGMVNSVLDMAKIEAGKMELHSSRESVHLMLDELMVRRTAEAGDRGLKLAVAVAPDVPEEIVCDRVRVQQILDILIDNALRFTRSGSICLGARRGPAGIGLWVEDTGCGISPELHRAIEERFRDCDRSGVGLRDESGLGLALACDLAQLMGGHMRVESSPGIGSRFELVLPVEPAC